MTPASKGEREVAEEILLKNTKAVMADKGYDSVDFRKFIEEQGMIAIIPPRYMWEKKKVVNIKTHHSIIIKMGKYFIAQKIIK